MDSKTVEGFMQEMELDCAEASELLYAELNLESAITRYCNAFRIPREEILIQRVPE